MLLEIKDAETDDILAYEVSDPLNIEIAHNSAHKLRNIIILQ